MWRSSISLSARAAAFWLRGLGLDRFDFLPEFFLLGEQRLVFLGAGEFVLVAAGGFERLHEAMSR